MNILTQYPPSPPVNIKFKNGTLTWDVLKTSDEMQRQVYWVVYKFKRDEMPDISNPARIEAIVNVPFHKTGKERGFKYVVTALDRLQNESKPSAAVVR